MSQPVKVVLVGDAVVGKTNLVTRYTKLACPDYTITTQDIVSEDYKANLLHNGNPVSLTICDTKRYGDEYAKLRALSYPKTDVFLICMSVIAKQGFNPYDRVWKQWYPEISLHSPKTPFILVGTKCDLRDKPEQWETGPPYSFADMRHLARRMGAVAYVECSAVTGKNVVEVFNIALSIVTERNSLKRSRQDSFLSTLLNKLFMSSNSPERPRSLGMMVQSVETSEDYVRWGHAAVYLSQHMYIFCGVLENNTLIWNGSEWDTTNHSEEFEKRNFPAATHYIDKKIVLKNEKIYRFDSAITALKVPKILLFGGKSNGYRADVHIFNPETEQFTLIVTTGTAPSPRYGMTCVTYNNCMYMMGGYDNASFICNDLYKLNAETQEWQQLTISGIVPGPRMFHTAVCFNNIMVVYGGKGEKNTILDDLYLIDLDTGHSTRCMILKSPGPRQHHACVAVSKQEMVLIGGITPGGVLSSDVFVFHLGTKQWTKVGTNIELPKMQMHTAVFTGTDILVFGGKDEKDKPLLCTKLTPDFLANHIYEVLPKNLLLNILGFLEPLSLLRFGQACTNTHILAAEDPLWIDYIHPIDPTYEYIEPENSTQENNKYNYKSKKNYNTERPKKYFEILKAGLWKNNFEIAPDPKPKQFLVYEL